MYVLHKAHQQWKKQNRIKKKKEEIFEKKIKLEDKLGLCRLKNRGKK